MVVQRRRKEGLGRSEDDEIGSTYEAELLEPAKDSVVAMGRYLNAISPAIHTDPPVNASI